jgi:hypothetical protein
MKNKIISGVLSLVAGFGLFAVVAVAPASANWECPNGVLCAWDGTDGNSTRWIYSFSKYLQEHNGCWSLSSSEGNNDWGSVFNRYGSGYAIKYYVSGNCTGTPSLLNPSSFASFNGIPSWNNAVSSYHIIPH